MSPVYDICQPDLSNILNEVSTLLMRIAGTVAVDDLLHVQQFHDMIFRLCDKAPDTAQGIADAIQKRLNSQKQTTGVNIRPLKRKRRRNQDAPYTSNTRTKRMLRPENENQGCINDKGKSTVIPNTGLSVEATSATTATTDKEQPSEPMEILGTIPSLPLTLDRSITRGDSIIEDVFEVAQTLHQLSKHRDYASNDIHKRIFKLFQGNLTERQSASTGNEWSDGSVWVRVLNNGWAQQKKVTILNMLEYMGAWEWYDGQVKIAQGKLMTKRGHLVGRQEAAISVLDVIERLEIRTEEQPRWTSGVGQVTVHDEAVHVPQKSLPTTSGIQIFNSRRKQINMQLSRGQKLTTMLIKKLGIGILFHRKIWEFTKLSIAKLDELIQRLQNNSSYTKLLHILSSQLECILWKGSPDLNKFFTNIQEEDLLAENKLKELQGTFLMQHRDLLHSKVNTAIDDLIKRVQNNILAGSKPDHDDGFKVNGGVEITCNTLKRLYPGQWLDCWAISTAMHISDKPANVTYDLSIPLVDDQKNNHERPLARWATNIDKHKQKVKDTLGAAPLVHFCPINHQNNHFTLLELNEKTRMICHYNSITNLDTIIGIKKTRISKLVQEEFGSLGFSYLEAPTPQQKDKWSCGIQVI